MVEEEKKAPEAAPKATPKATLTPAEWAKAKGTDPMLLAAATVGKLWDRSPALELSEKEFDAAIKWAGEVSAG